MINKVIKTKKGTALFITLTILLVAIILGNVILTIMLSHSRLTQHQVGRIQAYYAAKGAVNYALERLRTGAWAVGTNCTPATPCSLASLDPNFSTTFPNSLQDVEIVLRAPSDPLCVNPPSGAQACIITKAIYRTLRAE